MSPLQPAILTIFGITGDLAGRKLMPALYYLYKNDLLPESFKIVGVTRTGTTTEKLLVTIRNHVEGRGEVCDEAVMVWLEQAISIVEIDITKDDEYVHLKSALDAIEDKLGVCLNRLFYLAIPPAIFGQVAHRLGRQGLNTGCQHGGAESRLLIEKPFGYDTVSAMELIQQLQESFSEAQIYRIDHYLAKETVQNILTLRFKNPLFSRTWNSDHITHIIVTAAEEIGIEGRVAFYEQTGALRDLFQSHLLQLVALVTMEEPHELTSDAIHASKLAQLERIRPPRPDIMHGQAVRGQYMGYTSEVSSPESETETYAAVRLSIDDDRWREVPIMVRTGKSLTEKVTEIIVVFQDKAHPDCMNTLTIRIQPNEGIVLDLRIKKPGFDDDIEHVQMDFCYGESLDVVHPDAYERVFVDVLRGDKTLFSTSEEILASWRISEPILSAWQAQQSPLCIYEQGTWGPEAADDLIQTTGLNWPNDPLHICSTHVSHNKIG